MASFSDDFNRANGALGANYTTFSGLTTLNVNTNAAAASALGQNANMVAVATADFADDHECECTVTVVNSFDLAGLIVRGDAANANGYLAIFDGRDAVSCRIERMDAGVRTSIGNVNIDVAVNDVVRVRAEGTTLTVYVNDVLIDTVTDATYASGQPGLYYRWEDSNVTRVDAFSATDLGPAGPTITTQPANQTVVLTNGNTASFTVAATASGGSLTYQWQRDTGSGFSDITGATSATLNLSGVVIGDNGYDYRCNVTDANGTTASASANLAVYRGPRIATAFGATNGSGVSTGAIETDFANSLRAGSFIRIVDASGARTSRIGTTP